jgi:hypothetical protein
VQLSYSPPLFAVSVAMTAMLTAAARDNLRSA